MVDLKKTSRNIYNKVKMGVGGLGVCAVGNGISVLCSLLLLLI